nr:aminotransferase class V-fold PLP-dependent enzyme [Pseudomonas aeruginosa]
MVGGLCRGPGRPSTDTGDQQLRRIRFQQPVPARRAPAARAGAAPDRRARRRRTAVATARRAVARPRPGQTPLLSLSAVPTGHGAATALEGVAERIRAHDGLFFLDASHAVGQLPLAVEAIGCDVLVFPPRKWLRGPKGLGVLYLGERALERLALPDGLDVGGAQWSDAFALQARDDARRFECSEFNPGLRLALKASCDYLLQTDVRRIARRNRQLRERIAQQLYRRLGWTPLEQGPHASALMTYAAPELSGEQWLKRLHARGVNASYIGPQYARWALREQALPGVLRLTPHYLTDDGEIERLCEALEDCLRQRAAS